VIGKRTLLIAFGWMALVAYLGWVAGAEHLGDLGGVIGATALGVTGIIGGREAGKVLRARAGQ